MLLRDNETSVWCSLLIFWANHRLITWCWHLTLDSSLLWQQLPCGEGKHSLPCVAPLKQASCLVSDDSVKPPHPWPQNFDFCGGGEGVARLSMKAMHQNAFAVPLITRRCLRNNRLDWISHPFFSMIVHLAVAWSHWQPNANDWRVRGGSGGQKRREKPRSERISLKDEAGRWKSGWLKLEESVFESGWRRS